MATPRWGSVRERLAVIEALLPETAQHAAAVEIADIARRDGAEDSAQWHVLLTWAADYDADDPHGLYGLLSGCRWAGARLAPDPRHGYRLVWDGYGRDDTPRAGETAETHRQRWQEELARDRAALARHRDVLAAYLRRLVTIDFAQASARYTRDAAPQVQRCRSCGAAVEWRRTAAGKLCPYDAGTDVSHFTTCTEPKRWSKRNRNARQNTQPEQEGLRK